MDDAWQAVPGYHFSGRVTKIRPSPQENSSRLATLFRNTRMLFTHGRRGLVTWRVVDNEWTVRADNHGYWALAGNHPLNLPPGWHEIDSIPAPSSPAGMLVVDPRNPIGLISDIDDTILITQVLSKRALLKNSLTVPPEKRAAVPGSAELYRKLLQQNPVADASPVFYLSSSPRQLTDNLRRFLAAGGFPRGILQLKEVSRERGDSPADPNAYKLRHLERIFAAFPQVRFHLFGDDAESDPEIYATIREKLPGQVAGTWIRHLNPDKKRAIFPGQRDVRELKL